MAKDKKNKDNKKSPKETEATFTAMAKAMVKGNPKPKTPKGKSVGN